jgi:hypothetical protein
MPQAKARRQETAGSPQLTAEKLHEWFSEECRRGSVPSREQLAPFSNFMNFHGKFQTSSEPQHIPDLDDYKAAVRSLQKAILPVIAVGERALHRYRFEYDNLDEKYPFHTERLHTEEQRLQKLLALKAALDRQPFRIAPKRRHVPWHTRAELIAVQIDAAFKAAGRTGGDFKSVESPAIKIAVRALAHLGHNVTASAIVNCLRESKALARFLAARKT